MAGPIARTYKAGSIIYFEGDRGDDVFVLQKGRIILISTSLDQKNEVKDDVRKGEFFGVKSSVGHYLREETAQVLTDSVVLVFPAKQFEALCLKNTRIVLQMLKVFSSQLRKVHSKVREILGEMDTDENSVELMKVAEYYYKQDQLDQALYGYEAYLKHYPDGILAARANTMCQSIKKGQSYPLDVATLDEEVEEKRPNQGSSAFGFDTEELSGQPASVVDDMSPPPLGELDDNSDFSDGLDSGESSNVSALYYDGINAVSQDDMATAITKFEAVLKIRQISANDAKIPEQAMFELSKALAKSGQTDKSMESYTLYVKKHPRSDNLKKAILAIAELCEKKNDLQRATSLYNKVAQMPPKDRDTAKAAQKLKVLLK